GRAPCGPPVTGVHVPSLPLTSHASHWPSQALSQHSPSTQWPAAHSVELVHFELLLLRHVPALGPAAAHAAPAPQLATPQHTPSAQCPEMQLESPVQVSPRAWAPTHEPVLQKFPFVQSVSSAHVVRQAVVPHA